MGTLVTLLPLLLMMVLMYFMIVRPQQKQMNEKQEMLKNLKPGDSVVTIGGLHGEVYQVRQAERLVELDCEGVILTFALDAISRVDQAATNPEVEALSPDTVVVEDEEVVVVEEDQH